jgi:hypothetical protein
MTEVKFLTKKSYATRANAIAAATKSFGHTDLRYFIYAKEDGRFIPVFIGEAAVQEGVHFEFSVVC